MSTYSANNGTVHITPDFIKLQNIQHINSNKISNIYDILDKLHTSIGYTDN